jgi:hypothetical protein
MMNNPVPNYARLLLGRIISTLYYVHGENSQGLNPTTSPLSCNASVSIILPYSPVPLSSHSIHRNVGSYHVTNVLEWMADKTGEEYHSMQTGEASNLSFPPSTDGHSIVDLLFMFTASLHLTILLRSSFNPMMLLQSEMLTHPPFSPTSLPCVLQVWAWWAFLWLFWGNIVAVISIFPWTNNSETHI